MTNLGIVNGIKTSGNGRHNESLDFEAAGFVRVGWNKFSYTWDGVGFAKFVVKPGLISGPFGKCGGLVAECAEAEVKLEFEYGTAPEVIKEVLDDAILEIVSYNADEDHESVSPIDWEELEAEGLVIDFDDFMSGQWVRS